MHSLRFILLPLGLSFALTGQTVDLQKLDQRIQELEIAKRYGDLADLYESLPPKELGRRLSSYFNTLSRAKRWERLAEAGDILVPRIDKELGRIPPLIQNLYIQALVQVQRPKDAVAQCMRSNGPGTQPAYFWALNIAWHSGDNALLLSTADQILILKPDFGEAWVLKGEKLSLLLRPQEAEPCLEKAVALLPRRASAWSNLAYCRQERDASEEALAAADTAIQIDPKLIAAHYNRARALVGLKRYADARDEMKATLALGPEEAMRSNLEAYIGNLERHLATPAQAAPVATTTKGKASASSRK